MQSMRLKLGLDRGLLFVAVFLMGIGLVQVYSSSFIFAIERYDDGLFFFKKQALFVVLGAIVMMAVSIMPLRYLKILLMTLFAGSVVGVALTYLPGLGVRVGGAHRWLQLPLGLRLEPSEYLKITFSVLLAYWATRDWQRLKLWQKFLALITVVVPLILLVRQPDFGSFAICVLTFFSVLFALGMAWGWVVVGGATAVTAFYFLIVRVPYRMARVTAFLDPWSDPEAKGFQVIQSLLSFYSGGLSGAGLGQGQGKLFFLPSAHTDFTAAVLGEEMGFIGVLILLGLFGFLILRGFQVTARTENRFWQIVALGITIGFGLNSTLNFAVAMGLLPTKGLALPFISYGGSSLVASSLAMGVLLCIDRENRRLKLKSFKSIQVS